MNLTNVRQILSYLNVKHLTMCALTAVLMMTQAGCHKNLGFQTQNDRKNKITINTKDQRVFNETTTLSTGEKCYQDLCSANENSLDFKYILNYAKQGNSQSHQMFEQDIHDDLQKLLNMNLQLQSYQQKSINQLKLNLDNLKLNQLQTNFFFFIEYYVHQGSELKKSETNNDRVQSLKTIINQTKFIKILTANENHPEKFYLELHSKENINDALNEEIKFIKDLNKKAKQDFKELYNESTDLFTELLSQQEKNAQLLKRAMNKSTTIHLFNDVIYTDLLKKNRFDFPDLKAIIQDRFENLLKSRFDNQKSIENKMNQCRTTWNANFNLHPNDQQILKLKNKTQEVVQGMKSFLIAKYPELTDTLANIQFQYPENKQTTKRRWTDTIQKRHSTYEQYKDIFERLSLENKFIFTLINLKSLIDFDCEVLFDIDPMDQFNTREKRVTLSWVPAMYPQFATALISHEVAHYIFDYIDSFYDEKMCLAAKKGSEKYLEEDFSDNIASSYLLSIKENQENEYYACALASLDEKQSLKNNDFFDNHSTNLYRALQHHLHQGKNIPDSCNDLIKEEQINDVEKNCASKFLN